MRYPHVATLLFGVPLMASPAAAHAFADAFIAMLGDGVAAPIAQQSRPEPDAYTSRHAGTTYKDKPYAVTDSGIGILPVYGTMVQRWGQIDADCMPITSYEGLSRRFDAMVADPDVRAILLEMDSPGGQVAGAFEFARRIQSAREKKPIWAHANEHAYSAGYALAASASRVFMADTGGVANIGVLMLHMGVADRDARMGYEYTAFYSGARKNDFNPHFKLSSEAKASAQQLVNNLHNTFAQHVAQARGITVEQVNATESAALGAPEALAGKFVDGVASFSETVAMLDAELARTTIVFPGTRMAAAGSSAVQSDQEVFMSTTTAAKEFTKAELDTAVANALAAQKSDHDAALAAAKTAGIAEGKAAERARVKAIGELPEAAKRPAATSQVMLATDMDVKAAQDFLAKLPEESAGKAGLFVGAMAALGNPQVGAGGGDPADDKPVVIDAAAIFASRAAASGQGAA